MLKVKIKKLHPEAVIPKYAKNGDAGLDLVATSNHNLVLYEDDVNSYWCFEYKTGLSVEIPEGYVGLIFPRSSISKKDLIMANCVGVIDSGYRGEITCRFKETPYDFLVQESFYKKGDRIAQMIILPYPQVEFIESDELSETERGSGGYGSTGK